MYEKTVVGWDGSAPAQAAVDWAVLRVEGRGNGLLIVSVVDDTFLDSDEVDTRWAIAVSTFALAELAARLRTAHSEMDVNTTVAVGEPADMLNRYANSDSLIVVGSEHGHTDEYWYSSRLGARLAATASGAVAVVPVADGRRRSGVIVGIGGANEPLAVGLFAAEIAHRWDEELHLIYACPGHRDGSDTASADSDEAVLDRVLIRISQAFPTLAIHRHIEHTTPAAALLLGARDASLIVVGARRPGVARRLFLGSVSHTLVNNAPCPTIVVAKKMKAPM